MISYKTLAEQVREKRGAILLHLRIAWGMKDGRAEELLDYTWVRADGTLMIGEQPIDCKILERAIREVVPGFNFEDYVFGRGRAWSYALK